MDEILASLKQNTHSPGSHEQLSSSGQDFEGSSAIPDAHVRRRKSLLDLFRPRGVTEYDLFDASGEQLAAASANPFFSLTRSMSRGRSALHRSLSRSRSSSPVKDSNATNEHSTIGHRSSISGLLDTVGRSLSKKPRKTIQAVQGEVTDTSKINGFNIEAFRNVAPGSCQPIIFPSIEGDQVSFVPILTAYEPIVQEKHSEASKSNPNSLDLPPIVISETTTLDGSSLVDGYDASSEDRDGTPDSYLRSLIRSCEQVEYEKDKESFVQPVYHLADLSKCDNAAVEHLDSNDILAELSELGRTIDAESRRQISELDKVFDAGRRRERNFDWLSSYPVRQSSREDRYVKLALPDSALQHFDLIDQDKPDAGSSRPKNEDDAYITDIQNPVDRHYRVSVGGDNMTELFSSQVPTLTPNNRPKRSTYGYKRMAVAAAVVRQDPTNTQEQFTTQQQLTPGATSPVINFTRKPFTGNAELLEPIEMEKRDSYNTPSDTCQERLKTGVLYTNYAIEQLDPQLQDSCKPIKPVRNTWSTTPSRRGHSLLAGAAFLVDFPETKTHAAFSQTYATLLEAMKSLNDCRENYAEFCSIDRENNVIYLHLKTYEDLVQISETGHCHLEWLHLRPALFKNTMPSLQSNIVEHTSALHDPVATSTSYSDPLQFRNCDKPEYTDLCLAPNHHDPLSRSSTTVHVESKGKIEKSKGEARRNVSRSNKEDANRHECFKHECRDGNISLERRNHSLISGSGKGKGSQMPHDRLHESSQSHINLYDLWVRNFKSIRSGLITSRSRNPYSNISKWSSGSSSGSGFDHTKIPLRPSVMPIDVRNPLRSNLLDPVNGESVFDSTTSSLTLGSFISQSFEDDDFGTESDPLEALKAAAESTSSLILTLEDLQLSQAKTTPTWQSLKRDILNKCASDRGLELKTSTDGTSNDTFGKCPVIDYTHRVANPQPSALPERKWSRNRDPSEEFMCVDAEEIKKHEDRRYELHKAAIEWTRYLSDPKTPPNSKNTSEDDNAESCDEASCELHKAAFDWIGDLPTTKTDIEMIKLSAKAHDQSLAAHSPHGVLPGVDAVKPGIELKSYGSRSKRSKRRLHQKVTWLDASGEPIEAKSEHKRIDSLPGGYRFSRVSEEFVERTRGSHVDLLGPKDTSSSTDLPRLWEPKVPEMDSVIRDEDNPDGFEDLEASSADPSKSPVHWKDLIRSSPLFCRGSGRDSSNAEKGNSSVDYPDSPSDLSDNAANIEEMYFRRTSRSHQRANTRNTIPHEYIRVLYTSPDKLGRRTSHKHAVPLIKTPEKPTGSIETLSLSRGRSSIRGSSALRSANKVSTSGKGKKPEEDFSGNMSSGKRKRAKKLDYYFNSGSPTRKAQGHVARDPTPILIQNNVPRVVSSIFSGYDTAVSDNFGLDLHRVTAVED